MAEHLWAISHAAPVARDPEEHARIEGYAAGLSTWLLAATVFIAVKAVSDEMPPWTLCCARSLISALVLAPLVVRHRHAMAGFLRRRWLQAAVIGAIGLGLTQGVLFTALSFTSAINTGIVFALAPMITMVLARLLLGEAMGPWQAIGSLVAFCGIVTISVQGSIARLLGLDIGVGDLIALGAAVMFASYTVLLKRAKFELPRIPLLVILLAAGSLASFPFALIENVRGAHENLTPRGHAALLYIGIIGGALMYQLYNLSIERLGAARAGTLVYSHMLFVTLFAWLFLGEGLAWYHLAGGSLVMAGVLLVVLRPAGQAARGRA